MAKSNITTEVCQRLWFDTYFTPPVHLVHGGDWEEEEEDDDKEEVFYQTSVGTHG